MELDQNRKWDREKTIALMEIFRRYRESGHPAAHLKLVDNEIFESLPAFVRIALRSQGTTGYWNFAGFVLGWYCVNQGPSLAAMKSEEYRTAKQHIDDLASCYDAFGMFLRSRRDDVFRHPNWNLL